MPKEITDRDLDSHGIYNFHKLLKMTYPKDFAGTEKLYGSLIPKKEVFDVLNTPVEIRLSNNFDIDASIEFEFD